MSNDFSAINSLISSVLLVTDCTFNTAQFSDLSSHGLFFFGLSFFLFHMTGNSYHKFRDQCLC